MFHFQVKLEEQFVFSVRQLMWINLTFWTICLRWVISNNIWSFFQNKYIYLSVVTSNFLLFLQVHGFDFVQIKTSLKLNFYLQIKLVNYIRRCVHLNTCIGNISCEYLSLNMFHLFLWTLNVLIGGGGVSFSVHIVTTFMFTFFCHYLSVCHYLRKTAMCFMFYWLSNTNQKYKSTTRREGGIRGVGIEEGEFGEVECVRKRKILIYSATCSCIIELYDYKRSSTTFADFFRNGDFWRCFLHMSLTSP